MSNRITSQIPPKGIRFAPSPTGTFHIGNLRTAVVSYYWSTHLSTPWVVRFDDIDRPRVLEKADEAQLRDLQSLGMKPAIIQYQSKFIHRHREIFQEALRTGQAYPCICSRKEVQADLGKFASAPQSSKPDPKSFVIDAPVYSGHCRNAPVSAEHAGAIAWRFRSPRSDLGHKDFVIGRTTNISDMESFQPSYHFASAVDDYDGGFVLLVRAWDLGPATFPQRDLMTWLQTRAQIRHGIPQVFHAALVTAEDGTRLEKRTQGVTLAEIQSQGKTLEAIRRKLEMSFNPVVGYEEGGKDWMGEARQTIRVSELGL
ncbi:MAG: hypothetical protein JNL01_02715 [Bdellovibrionales bacterium]|nr:hypothetical protein [Bdellovibrionales bacterium]